MSNETSEFPFDFWAKLAQEDPDAFEKARKLMLDSLIEAAPARAQPRLKGLQWQIERIRSKAATPLSACLKISDMMWTNVLGEDGLAAQFDGRGHGEPTAATAKKAAEVLLFQRKPEPT